MDRYSAILLVGPTGSGKSPLGDCLEQQGLWQQACVHFDFGAQLRRVATASPAATGLSAACTAIAAQAVSQGRLLEDSEFPVARAILLRFARRRGLRPEHLLVLNGLPRHVSQAQAMEELVCVRQVIYLECAPATVLARIRADVAGDRVGREDDTLPAVEARLRLFAERTLPLLDFYRDRGARIRTVQVSPTTTAVDTRRELNLEP